MLSPHCVLDFDTPAIRIIPNWSWAQAVYVREILLKTEDGTNRKSVFFFWGGASDYKIRLPIDVTSACNP